MGKSALAAYFYHSLDFEAKFWADVRLKPDLTIFAEHAIKALGGKVSYPIDATQLINNLLGLLSQRRCLLVVDNLETLLDNNRKWQDENYQQFFSCWQQQGTNSTLLITTQDKPKIFQGLQQWYSLGGMKLAEGVSLLNKLAIQGTVEELKTFVEYINGHPLTIKLVAGYLNEYCDRQLSQVKILGLEQFELAYQEAEGLHRSKQDARLSWIIQQHLDRLNLEQKVFLTNLSVYRLPFNWEAASYMWMKAEVKPFIIQKKLQDFCNRSLLIKTEENKFQFESLVQRFILQQTENLTDAHKKAIEYYKANLKDESSWQVLEDVAEYLEIFNHYCELKQFYFAYVAVNNCCNFLTIRSYYPILLDSLNYLVSKWQINVQKDKNRSFAYALMGIGNTHSLLGNYDLSIDFYTRSLEIQENEENVLGVASCLLGIGNVFNSMANYQQGVSYNQKALNIFLQENYDSGIANCLMNLGCAEDGIGNFLEAIDFYHRSLEIFQKIADINCQAKCLGNIGNTYASMGENTKAIKFYEQSLDIFTKVGNKKAIAMSLSNMTNAYLNTLSSCICRYEEDYKQIAIKFKQALKIQQEIGDRHGEACSLDNLGVIFRYLEKYSESIEYHQRALIIRQNIGDINGESTSLGNLGITYYDTGNYKQASKLFEQSLSITSQVGSKHDEANSIYNLGNCWNQLGQMQKAKSAYIDAKRIYQQLNLECNVRDCWRKIELIDIKLKSIDV